MAHGQERHVVTCESVTEGHPDKVADLISDAILDAHLAEDPHSRVACEVLCKADRVVVAGEITSAATVDVEAVIRETIRSVGYTDSAEPFHADGVRVTNLITRQAQGIANGVNEAGDDVLETGAGDQGLMYGYACDETPELMPLAIHLPTVSRRGWPRTVGSAVNRGCDPTERRRSPWSTRTAGPHGYGLSSSPPSMTRPPTRHTSVDT